MNSKKNPVSIAVKTALVGGLVVLSTQAIAAPPPWAQARTLPARHQPARQYDEARVVEVDPIVRRVRVETPRRECWDEVRSEAPRGARQATVGGTIVGGIIGGVLGSQIGHGRGQDAATIAGTLIGSSIGRDTAARRTAGPAEEYTVERCQTRYEDTYEERVDGYRVTYEYQGREYTTQLPYDPGDHIRVKVAVSPAEY